MTLENFIADFAAQLEETNPSTITASTKFREIEEWNSLCALSIIAMADDQYGVQLKGDDIRTAQTVEDIFQVIKSRK